MRNIERLLLLVFCLGLSALAATPARANGVPACPAGQVPTWDNSGCMSPQTPPSLSGYGIPASSKAYLPGGSVNSNPAMQDCNGIPIPIGQPCSAARPSLATMPISSIPSTIASQTQTTTASSTTTSSAVAPALGIVGVSSAAGAVSSVPGGSSSASAVTAPAIDATATLANLLGDWYTGWLQYLAGAFSFSQATQESISSSFLGLPACLHGQQQACEDAIWQAISQWVGPSLGQAGSGS